MKKVFFLFALLFSFALLKAQENAIADKASVGFGFGMDYGGLGCNLTVYPQENVGIFLGGGYAFAGFGYNAGLKLRLTPKKHFSPFLVGMYGYNAAIVVSNNSGSGFYNSNNLNKLFYGPSAGIGFDLGSFRRGYFSLAVLIPFRSPDVDNYIDELKNTYGVQFKNNLWPVTVSIGYKFVLH